MSVTDLRRSYRLHSWRCYANLVQRGCGLDLHQATVVACLLIVLKDGKIHKQVRAFGTTTRELVSLREWLLSEGCTHVATESAPHLSARGTSTLLNNALLSAHFRIADDPPEIETCLRDVDDQEPPRSA